MKFKTIIFTALFFLLGAVHLYSQQDKFRLEIGAPSYKGEMVYFLSYWNGDTYVQDSCMISNKGIGLIDLDKTLPAGQYLIFIKPDIQIEMLLDKGQDNIKLTINQSVGKSKIVGSKDTEILWEYIKEVNIANEKFTVLNEKINSNTISDSERVKTISQIEEVSKSLQSNINKIIQDNKGTWGSVFLKGLSSVDIPNKEPKTLDEAMENSSFMREHYFDHIDFLDSRMLRTNYFYSYLDNYLKNWVEQDVDSIASATSWIVGKAQGNKVNFDNLLTYFLNNSMSSNLMGMENVWARLAEDYIFKNDSLDISHEDLINLRSQYQILQYNRIGMTAHDLKLETLSGDSLNLYDIDSDYTILCFYSPSCAHCRNEIKSISEQIYPLYKDRGLKIITVNLYPDKDEWKRFIEEMKIEDWDNCADPKHKSEYWIYYDTTGVPSLYLLDKNKKIIAKKVNEESLKIIFGILYNENGINKGS